MGKHLDASPCAKYFIPSSYLILTKPLCYLGLLTEETRAQRVRASAQGHTATRWVSCRVGTQVPACGFPEAWLLSCKQKQGTEISLFILGFCFLFGGRKKKTQNGW